MWKHYYSLGRASSYDKLNKWARANGMRKLNTKGKGKMGVYFSMWAWALRNPKEAYPYWESWAKEHMAELMEEGAEINFDEFIKDIQAHAKKRKIVGERTYLEFCKKYNLEP